MSDETPHMTQTNFAFHSEDLYVPLIWRVFQSKQYFFCIFLSGNGKQQALQLRRM